MCRNYIHQFLSFTNVLNEFPAMFLLRLFYSYDFIQAPRALVFTTKCRSIFSFFMTFWTLIPYLSSSWFPWRILLSRTWNLGTFTGVFNISVDFLFNLFISEFSIFGLYLSGSKTQTINTLNLLNVCKLTFNVKQSFTKYWIQGFVHQTKKKFKYLNNQKCRVNNIILSDL